MFGRDVYRLGHIGHDVPKDPPITIRVTALEP